MDLLSASSCVSRNDQGAKNSTPEMMRISKYLEIQKYPPFLISSWMRKWRFSARKASDSCWACGTRKRTLLQVSLCLFSKGKTA